MGNHSAAYSRKFKLCHWFYATEPGSTFKLASYLAVMDDYGLNLDEKIQVGNGEVIYK